MWEVFLWKGKFRQKLLTAVLKSETITYIMCKRGEDDQGGTGKEFFLQAISGSFFWKHRGIMSGSTRYAFGWDDRYFSAMMAAKISPNKGCPLSGDRPGP